MNTIAAVLRLFETAARHPETRFNRVVGRFLEHLPPAGRGAVTRLAYGVLRKEYTIGCLLARYSKRPLARLDEPLPLILKTAIYMLLFSDNTPPYAVVDSAVKCARPSQKGFANAVLRRMAEDRAALRAEIAHSDDLGLRYSASPYLVQQCRRSGDVTAILEYLDREPSFHLRGIGPADLEPLRRRLQRDGIPFVEQEGLNTLEVKELGEILHHGAPPPGCYLQNSGSQAVSLLAAAVARQRVYDACSAPGSKSLTLRSLRPDLTLFAGDLRPGRLRDIQLNLQRLDLPGILPLAADARRPPLAESAVDFVLLDAPCSSSGTLRKNPDLKTRLDEARIAAHSALQRELLAAAASSFPQAVILYAVCSFFPEEGDEVVRTLPPGYESLDVSAELAGWGFSFRRTERGFLLLPSARQNDLFYLSLLRPLC